jgi:hypothetical protein
VGAFVGLPHTDIPPERNALTEALIASERKIERESRSEMRGAGRG